ncbi:MAG: hypothetical protein JO104_00945 [Candidatus Eremiobacteraeota bacterium]|nr:hypothetical protein [Candidatus Eremiobacteraeota bacterium]
MIPAEAPPALTQVAQRFSESTRGIVSFRMHRVFDARAGFSKRHEDLTLNGIYDDGTVVRVHVVSYSIDGKPAGLAAQTAVEQGWEHPKPGDVFAPPFDRRNFAAYQYQGDGPSKVDFTSSVRDAAHGDGTFSWDAQNNVVAYSYQPNALPPHASFGEITDRRAEVLPGYWAVTQELQSYKGTVGPFPGSGVVQLTFSDFRRFPDISSALNTL